MHPDQTAVQPWNYISSILQFASRSHCGMRIYTAKTIFVAFSRLKVIDLVLDQQEDDPTSDIEDWCSCLLPEDV